MWAGAAGRRPTVRTDGRTWGWMHCSPSSEERRQEHGRGGEGVVDDFEFGRKGVCIIEAVLYRKEETKAKRSKSMYFSLDLFSFLLSSLSLHVTFFLSSLLPPLSLPIPNLIPANSSSTPQPNPTQTPHPSSTSRNKLASGTCGIRRRSAARSLFPHPPPPFFLPPAPPARGAS